MEEGARCLSSTMTSWAERTIQPSCCDNRWDSGGDGNDGDGDDCVGR